MFFGQETPTFLLGQRDSYRVTPTILGSGSMGSTFEAIPQKKPNLLVAAKVLRTNPSEMLRSRAFQEANTTLKLQKNRHIIPLLDLPSDWGDMFLILEKAKFGSMKQFLGNKYPLEPKSIMGITEQLVEALQHTDDNNIIHRDVTPNNFLLTGGADTPFVYLADFSIAVEGSRRNPHRSDPTAGSPAYMSPEQFYGIVTPYADQYSLGVCVYRWISGNLPFFVEGNPNDPIVAKEYAQKHSKDMPPSLAQNSRRPFTDKDDLFTRESMMEVVNIALAKNPYKRFEDVGSFGEALQRAYDESLPQRRTSTP